MSPRCRVFCPLLSLILLLQACSDPGARIAPSDAGDEGGADAAADPIDAGDDDAGEGANDAALDAGQPSADGGPGGSDAASSVDAGTGSADAGPNQIPGAHALSYGHDGFCLLDADDALHCGNDPRHFKRVMPGPYTTYAVGYNHVCALRPDQTLDCRDSYQHKIPSGPVFETCRSPTQCVNGGAPPLDQRFIDVAVGLNNACAITTQGTITCFGDNDDNLSTPPATADFERISSNGRDVMCAIRRDRSAVCWGAGSASSTMVSSIAYARGPIFLRTDGSVQQGVALHSEIKIDRKLASLSAADIGNSVCGLDTAGEAHCWSVTYHQRETPFPGPFVGLAHSSTDVCALKADHSLWCWGVYFKGPGPERCRIGTYAYAWEGREFVQTVAPEGFSIRMSDAAPLWAYGAPSGWSYLMLTGPGRLGGSSGTVFRKRIPATARIPLEAVYWQLSRSIEQEPPPVMCAPPGSGSTFVQHFDELSITLRGVSALDKCPGGGTQVEGSFDFCMGNACADHVVRGAIDGVGFAAQTIASTWVDSAPFVLSDGSYLFNTRIWSVGTSAENPGMLLFPSPQSPLYGRIVCVGSGRSTGTDQARTWTLSDLSLLGPCPAGGSNSVEMCFR